MTDPTPATPTPPDFRTWIEGLDDESLTELLRARPDVIQPLPPSITPLAGRLQLRASVARAVRSLTSLQLAAVEAAADLGAEFTPVTRRQIVDALTSRAPKTVDPGLAAAAVDDLLRAGLLYGDDPVLLVREAMSVLPGGWRLLGEDPATAADLTERVASLDPRERAVLDTLAAAGGLGHTRDAAVDADPARPVPRLIAAGLLVRVDSGNVRLPRAVAQAVRGEAPTDIPLHPSARVRGEAVADPDAGRRTNEAGAGQGLEVTRRMSRLLDHLGAAPVALNRDATVGVRAVAQLGKALGHPVAEIHQLVSLGVAAGLIGRGEIMALKAEEDAQFLAPTKVAGEWAEEPLATQWARLLAGWWVSPFTHWRAGEKDDAGQPIRLLGDASRNERLSQRRALVTEPYVRAAEGVALSADDLLEDLHFLSPLSASAGPAEETTALAEEAQWIGAVAAGAATTWLRLLHAGDDEDVAAAVAAVTPPEVDRVIVQGDMTVMVPGPLPRQLQSQLELMADLESPGLASVYRISEASLRRALDAGRSAEDVAGWFQRHALGELPQSLTYLVADVARRHGGLRGGAIASYLRTEDPTLLDAVFAGPTAAEAGLRRLAPTVAVSDLLLAEVLERLRAGEHHAVAEDAEGSAVDIRPTAATVPAERLRAPARPKVDDSRVAAAVRALRRGAAEGEDGEDPRIIAGSESLSVLQAAARGGKTVTLGVVDKHGRALQATVKPLTVTGGQVDAVDEKTGKVQRFLLHRITQVIVD